MRSEWFAEREQALEAATDCEYVTLFALDELHEPGIRERDYRFVQPSESERSPTAGRGAWSPS